MDLFYITNKQTFSLESAVKSIQTFDEFEEKYTDEFLDDDDRAGNYLEKLLWKYDKSASAVSNDAGLARSYVGNVINRKKNNPSRDALIAICLALGTTVDELQYLLKYTGNAPLYVRRKRDVISGLVPRSPACMIPDNARNGVLLGFRFDPEHIPDIVRLHGDREFGGNYFRVAQAIHVEEAIDKYTGPVLLVHGDEDPAVPYQLGVEAAGRYRCGELAAIAGDGHCYERHLDQVVSAVKDWAMRQL